MALQHGWTCAIQFLVERLYNRGLIVASVMDAVSGEKIENAAAIAREKLGSGTALVTNVHLQDFEQSYPVRVYMIRIKRVEGRRGGCVCQGESFLQERFMLLLPRIKWT
jgi:hypothetical protein